MDKCQSTVGKPSLRAGLRKKRRALSRLQQKQASMRLCRQLLTYPPFLNSQRVAVYLANDGEIDLQPLIEQAWRLKKQVYLPVLHPLKPGHLLFIRHLPGQTLAKNRFGIPEPISAHPEHCKAWTLNLVLTPLVGFDPCGHRIGMGGGYYDRTFSFLHQKESAGQPHLIGVAHECQKLEKIDSDRWDIAMNVIATDEQIYLTTNR